MGVPTNPIGYGFNAHTVTDAEMTQAANHFIQQRGVLSDYIWNQIKITNPMMRLLQSVKKEFPSYMGDTYTRAILEVNLPGERSVMNWAEIKLGACGGTPCAFTLEEIPYGSRRISACLTKYGAKTPVFCKLDVAMAWKGGDQLNQIFMTMAEWSKGIWSHWLPYSYAKSVNNVVLNNQYGYPEQFGRPVTYCRPLSYMTFKHAEKLLPRMQFAGSEIGRPIASFETLVMGEKEAAAFIQTYRKEAFDNGFRTSDVNDYLVPEIGKVTRCGKYMVIANQCARRFREPASNEEWDDALVPSTIQVPVREGVATRRNPDYENEGYAKYTQVLWINLDAVDWLTPSAAMTAGTKMHPATNFSGEFKLIKPSTESDPFELNAYFAALFISGMMALRPDRGMAILARSAGVETLNLCTAACDPDAPAVVDISCNISDVAKLLTTGQLQVNVKPALPTACPDGYSLFIVTKNGNKYLINSLVNSQAVTCNGDTVGTIAVISLVDTAAAVDRKDSCDPWEKIACLPSNTLVSNANAGCAACGQTVTSVCTRRVSFSSDTVVNFKVDGSNVLTGGYTSAATLQTDLNTWLAGSGHGGGTAVVTLSTDSTHRWDIVITGNDNEDLLTAFFVYQDALDSTQNSAVLTAEGCD